MDKYEASVWRIPPGQTELISKVKNGSVTLADLQAGGFQQGATGDDYNCNDNANDWNVDEYAVSIAGVKPAAYITWFQAQQFCRMAGKRLATNAEWQGAAAGTPDGAPCVVTGNGPAVTGTEGCVSTTGAFDMVGNLWEWVADWVPSAQTPCSPGLFGTSDVNCMKVSAYSDSRFDGPAALLRGGFWAIGDEAGVFAIRGYFQPSVSDGGIGFRCAR